MKRAIVLSGGGGKGAYQIGVWKALRKLHIKYDIVTGTSVGALNGAFMVQKDYRSALRVWKNMSFKSVYNKDLKEDINTLEGKKELVSMYAKGIVIDGGMNIENLENLLDKYLDEKKVRKSKIDYGLITFNLTTLKALSYTKKDIPKGKLKDYMLASSTCYPVFKKKEIGENIFIDGGVYDNLPINLAISMGATQIIAVDLKAVGIKQKIKENSCDIITITPKNKINSFLVFDKDSSIMAIKCGYNDTMKKFGKLDGNYYTFKKNNLNKNYIRHNRKFIKNLKNIIETKNKNIASSILSITSFNKLLEGDSVKIKKQMDETIEYLGKIFDMDCSNVYDIVIYNSALLGNIGKLNNIKEIDSLIKIGSIKKLINKKTTVEYLYDKMLRMNEKNKYKKELCNLALLFPKEFLGALYLYTITKGI